MLDASENRFEGSNLSDRFRPVMALNGWRFTCPSCFYNLCPIHKPLRVIPAMEARITESYLID